MKTIRLLLLTLTLALASTSAFAWPTCNGHWVSVPKGTTNADGVLYSTGDLLFQCQIPTPPPVPPTTPSTTSNKNKNTNTNSNQNSNNNKNSSNSSSSAGAVSGSTSSSSATGGTGIGVATATGGKGGSASQGQDQGQSQSSTSSADGNGNGSNNTQYSSETNVEATKIPVATAYAPSVYPTVTCFKGFGAGVQTAPLGASFGGGKIDENCAILEAAGRAKNLLAFCKVYVSNKYVRKAGVTLEDCLNQPQPAPVAQTVIVPPAPVQPVVVDNEPITVVAPVESDVDNLVFSRSDVLSNVLKAQLDGAALYFKQASGGGYLVLEADSLTGVIRIQRVQSYLSEAGVNTSYIRVRLVPNFGRNVRIVYSLQ